MTYKLYTSKTGFRHETDDVLVRLIALTWESALPPALCALLNLIFYLAMQMNAVAMFFNILTPRLYVFSLMHTLNSRPALRSESRMGTSQHIESSDGMGRTKRGTIMTTRHITKSSKQIRSNLNADGASTIPVHVQTETTFHTTPADDIYERKEPRKSTHINPVMVRPVVSLLLLPWLLVSSPIYNHPACVGHNINGSRRS
ncbi:hypothetical protein FRC02_004006 [Tulasnella sp. 418]|nr:hypothetical protein FRC02_004006 [Tulasnella sp. 418]